MLAMLAAFLQLSCYTHKVLTVYSVGRGKEKYHCGHYLIAMSFVSQRALLTDARLHCLAVVGYTCMSVCLPWMCDHIRSTSNILLYGSTGHGTCQ